MSDAEQKLSDFIDRLNADLKPEEDEYTAKSAELRELYRTVRHVRRLREPLMPEDDFLTRLTDSVSSQVSLKKKIAKRKTLGWVMAIASVAAALLIWMNFLTPFGKSNIVNAMAEAYQEVNAYHGVLEIVTTTADGQSALQGKLDIWSAKDGRYYVKSLEGTQQGLVTVNDGKIKWQIQPNEQEVHRFPALPDAYRVQFEIGHEIEEAKKAISTRVIGEDVIAGRKATILEVTPEGGLAYRIWVDAETRLPLQKQTAMVHAIQYTFTYTQIEFANAIPEPLFTYQLPAGYKEIATNPEQIILDPNDAEAIVGFAPQLPEELPLGYVLDRIAVIPDELRVKIYYNEGSQNKQIIVTQNRATGEFKPDPNAVIGETGESIVEVLSPVAGDRSASSIRWQQGGMEFIVMGNLPIDILAAFSEMFMKAPMKWPDVDEQAFPEPTVEIEYDLAVEQSDQKNADAGSSPWKLDPAFVAQVFVSLQMMPDGITGDYPIAIEDLEITANNGVQAIVAVHDENSPISRVFVERVVRQDDSGIWTVVGYDPRQS